MKHRAAYARQRRALAPCPFCGSSAAAVTGPVPRKWGVQCEGCECWCDFRAETEDDAVIEWNRRGDDARNSSRLDATKAADAAWRRAWATDLAKGLERHFARDNSEHVVALAIADAMLVAQERIVDRLRNPDDALIQTVIDAIDDYYNGTKDAPFEGSVKHVLRAIAEHLEAEPQP